MNERMITDHGDDMYRYSEPIRYNFSSNVFGKIDLSGLKAHLKAHTDDIGSYPEPEPFTLESLLSERLLIPACSICVTGGATEAIYLIAQAYSHAHSAVLIPTFSEYEDACRINGHQVSQIHALDEIESGHQLVWLCNPNNPTGSVIDKEQLLDVFNSHPDVVFVIDQSYEYFTRRPLLSVAETAALPNVIQLHSMTKKFAIPGLRLGYFTAQAHLINQIRAYKMPWSVNSLAIEAGLYLLAHPEKVYLDKEKYLDECQWLRNSLLNLAPEIEILPTETHFMLVRIAVHQVPELKDFLVKHYGILIRDASNFAGLDTRYFRIATQTREENERLIYAIKEWLQKVSH